MAGWFLMINSARFFTGWMQDVFCPDALPVTEPSLEHCLMALSPQIGYSTLCYQLMKYIDIHCVGPAAIT